MKELPGDIHPDFPIKLELGKSMDENEIHMPKDEPKKEKKKKYYPCLYLSDIDGLEDVPREGHALIYFRKKSASVREDEEGKVHASADLEIEDIHFQAKDEEDDSWDMEEEMKSILDGKGKGAEDEESAESDDEDESEDEDEE